MSTAGITLKAAQADGFHYPRDYDPKKHKSLEDYQRKVNPHFEHFLGKNRTKNLQLSKADRLAGKKPSLVIRFELPFKIKCVNCGDFIGQGTRFDAEKTRVGNYYSTPIYEFKMKCGQIVDISQSKDYLKTHCNQEWVIRTDPKNCDYELVSGCTRPGGESGFRNEGRSGTAASSSLGGALGHLRDAETELDPLYMDLDARREMKQDPMFRLEKLAEMNLKRSGVAAAEGLIEEKRRALADAAEKRALAVEDEEESGDEERNVAGLGSVGRGGAPRGRAHGVNADFFQKSRLDVGEPPVPKISSDERIYGGAAMGGSTSSSSRIAAASSAVAGRPLLQKSDHRPPTTDELDAHERAAKEAREFAYLPPKEKQRRAEQNLSALQQLKRSNAAGCKDYQLNASLRSRHRDDRKQEEQRRIEAAAAEGGERKNEGRRGGQAQV
eukprot:CAMPEP_0178995644 /NCGR_PEP_ID=MMETSP0795-20121207/7931_1 /TAXON_ID=88552 /ORGANISM="Amoebophrya sp., Strain Ameob2" /LENGTH=439 /DNA_ID=CAMNT_0020687953 /DNA_START=164 /DNA_END=1482 /DNA_ORIENTATION=+